MAHAYVRFADAQGTGEEFDPDFDVAVRRHRLLAAIERSSETRSTVSVPG